MEINKDLYLTEAQKRRLVNIDNILKRYNELDIPDNIIHRINKKFKSTKYYRFIRTEEIETGMIIRCVDLDMKNISITGIIVNINKTNNKNIGTLTLYNNSINIYWKINPDKYYLFHLEKGATTDRKIRELKLRL
jgi:hypothetical protein